jgi:hypothetical protein
MLRGRFFFFDVFVDQARDAAAAKAAGRFVLGFAFGVAHEALIERFFRADEVVVVKSQFAALAALKIFCHRTSFQQAVEKVSPASLRLIASIQRTTVADGRDRSLRSIFRAPRIWDLFKQPANTVSRRLACLDLKCSAEIFGGPLIA